MYFRPFDIVFSISGNSHQAGYNVAIKVKHSVGKKVYNSSQIRKESANQAYKKERQKRGYHVVEAAALYVDELS